MKRRLCGLLCAAAMMLTAVPATTTTVFAADQCDQGTQDGYDYELWNQNYQGSVSMKLNGNGAFSCSWSGIENCLFRTGKRLGSTKPYGDYKGIYIDYDVDYQPKGNSYMCVYGWTQNPLVEYYIVEAWGSWRPPGNAQSLGTVNSDGHKYDIYKTMRYNQPSIEGTKTFAQYWSVRQDNPAQNNTMKNIQGTITVSNHFDQWGKAGLDMSGKMYEVALNVEGYQSNGSADVKKNNLVFGKIPDGNDDPPKKIEPDENGYYFHSTYESGDDNWGPRGENTVAVSKSAAYEGQSSLFVSGRKEAWNGASISLDTAAFQPGSAYSFSTMVKQDASASEDMALTLQYTDSTGTDQYVNIAKAAAPKGQWTQLANTSFEIPTGASNLLLYVETPENLIDFYVDEAIGAVDGKVIVVTPPDPVYMPGDLNHSEKVDIADVVAMAKFLMGESQTMYGEEADLNGDGKINALDFTLLKRLLLGVGVVDKTTAPKETTTTTTTTTTKQLQPGQWDNRSDISWIDKSKPMVALSFDDGPVGTASSATSIRIQDALSNNNGHATFFYWGNKINSGNEGEITRAKKLGFEVSNHTYTHPYLTNLSASGVKDEINQTSQILTRLTGDTNFLIRPPYLAVNSTVQQNCGAPLITCAIDSKDWDNASQQQIINTITSGMSNGSLRNSVVLMHETYTTTAGAVEYLAPYFKQQGWQIVTISEMFKANNKDMFNGQVYTGAK